MCATTAQDLLNDKPTNSEVERVDDLWGMFNSTTQFLSALRLVLIEREVLDHEVKALDQFLPVLAQAEADNMNVPLADLKPGKKLPKYHELTLVSKR